jgi:curved DNA-binding protein CbpA
MTSLESVARAVLCIDPGADVECAKKAYRRLAKRFHPDICRDPGAGRRFKRVLKAYKTLEIASARGEPSSVALRLPTEDPYELGQALLRDVDPACRAEAARRLGLSGKTSAFAFLRYGLRDPDESVAKASIRAVAMLGCRQAEADLGLLYSRADASLRRFIVETAAGSGERSFASAVRMAENDPDQEIAKLARLASKQLREGYRP